MTLRSLPSALVASFIFVAGCYHAKPVPPPAPAPQPAPPPAPPPPPPAPPPAPAPPPKPEPPPPPPPPKATLGDNAIVLAERIDFQEGKAELLPASESVLKEVADVLKAHAELKIEIEGYTANDGVAAKNVKLSKERAEAVKKWLTEHGIEGHRLTAKGFGPKSPIADNATDEGKAKNRRIEFKIVKKK